jgi:hypothetical protein
VRAEAVCPFCAAPLPARPPEIASAAPRQRTSRAALFAAGAASLASVAACSSSTKTPDAAATDTMAMSADTASDKQSSDSPFEAKDAQSTDAPRDFGGGIPIYSAVFPPTKTRVASTTPPPARHGRPGHRTSR